MNINIVSNGNPHIAHRSKCLYCAKDIDGPACGLPVRTDENCTTVVVRPRKYTCSWNCSMTYLVNRFKLSKSLHKEEDKESLRLLNVINHKRNLNIRILGDTELLYCFGGNLEYEDFHSYNPSMSLQTCRAN